MTNKSLIWTSFAQNIHLSGVSFITLYVTLWHPHRDLDSREVIGKEFAEPRGGKHREPTNS